MLRAVGKGRLLRPDRGGGRLRLPMTTAALEDVWRELHMSLLRFIERRVGDPSDAEDVLQDVMLRIHRHAGEMDEYENLGGWVHQVARSAVIDFYRRRSARPELPAGDSIDVAGETPDAGPPEALRTELAECLRPLLSRLPEKYREALEPAEFERGRAQLRDVLLECCHVELDRRGGVADYRARAGQCSGC